MSPKQLDLYAEDAEPDLFGPDNEPVVYLADPDRIRARLHKVLAEARTAQTLPWDARRLGFYRAMFSQMTLSLPEEEGAQLRFEFESEVERLDAA